MWAAAGLKEYSGLEDDLDRAVLLLLEDVVGVRCLSHTEDVVAKVSTPSGSSSVSSGMMSSTHFLTLA